VVWGILLGIAVLAVIVFLAVQADRAKSRRLTASTPGSTRIESVKAAHVNNTVKQYNKAGWEIVDQSSAKSLGSQARVTITFRKR
jgi:hypothetical protein